MAQITTMSSTNSPRGSFDVRSGIRILPPGSRPDLPIVPPQKPSPEPLRPTTGQMDSNLPWPFKSSSLCGECSKIDFGQFAPTAAQGQTAKAPTTVHIVSLSNIIKNQKDRRCKFCSLLFEAIALPMHDPFEHPAIKDHMPSELKNKSFRAWAKGLKWFDQVLNSAHPFGKTRNKIKINLGQDGPDAVISEIRSEDLEVAQQVGLLGVGAGAGTAIHAALTGNGGQRTVLSVLGAAGLLFALFLSIMDHALPAVVTVKLHNINSADGGLLNIDVLGYGNKVQAPLSILSSFNLRVASTYQEKEMELHYGKLLGNMVDVEFDCRKWLMHCHSRHRDHCERPDWALKLPPPSGEHFRLIKIDGHDHDRFSVVQVDAESQGSPLEYAALSYVWGDAGEKAVSLHARNVSQFNRRVPPNLVARTIKDAIKVTRRLGIQYLWADSLCVIQKDRRGEDDPEARQSQLDMMGSIYGHACVVIVAADGEDAGSGLAGISMRRIPGQLAEQVKPDVNVLLPIQYEQSYGKWDTRAWTLQEKLLSRRMLVFGANHVSFHCRHGVLREDMPAAHAANGPPQMHRLSMPQPLSASATKLNWDGSPIIKRSPFFDQYAKLLQQYTSRDRSNSNDILRAVLGLLRVLETMRRAENPKLLRSGTLSHALGQQDHTLHGLPEEFLDLALLWQPPAAIGTHLTMRTNDLLPSWSWAGWEVGKDISHYYTAGKPHLARPGVRFEEPFWVSAHDDMSLKKFIATDTEAEERFSPLVLWYKWAQDAESPVPVSTRSTRIPNIPSRPPPPPPKAPLLKPKPQHLRTPTPPTRNLVPINGTGLGIICDSRETEARLLEKVRRFMPAGDWRIPHVPPGIPLNSRHLVCETQVGTFRLRQKDKTARKECLWTKIDEEVVIARELEILEAEILDEFDNVIGFMIPTDQRKTISPSAYDFILLSESQYWGNEKRIDVMGFPLYNIMVIEWDTRKECAKRFGLGKISKSAWDATHPSWRCVILK